MPRPRTLAFPLIVLALGLASPAGAMSDVMHLASGAPPPAPFGGNGVCFSTAVAGGGRFVAFSSTSTNLVVNDLNQYLDVFVRDLATGTLTRESLSTNGQESIWGGAQPALSGDGRWVVFHSQGALDPSVPGAGGVYLRDRMQGTTRLVSIADSGAPPDIWSSFDPSISHDGRFVAFHSGASNLVPNDTAFFDVFLVDVQTSNLVRISQTPLGASANGDSRIARLSSNGRFVVFVSWATNLAPGDLNNYADVYVFDRQTTTMTLESVSTSGAAGDDLSGAHPQLGGPTYDGASISDDGRWLVFESAARNLVPGDTNGYVDVFLRDRLLGTTTRINTTLTGGECDMSSLHPRISADGRFVVFNTGSTNMVPGDVFGWDDVFVFDRIAGTTSQVSRSVAGTPGDSSSFRAWISDSGRVIAFASTATNLVPSDPNGGIVDVFALDRGFDLPPYCAGDGTAAACPCGNLGASGKGCDNSFATGGARLETMGFALVSHDSLQLQATGLPPTTTCLFLQGAAQLAGGQGVPFGDGLRCVGGVIVRLGSKVASSGTASYGGPASGDVPLSIRGGIPASGGLFHYQVWYRNAASFCTPASFNLSNGTSVPWLP